MENLVLNNGGGFCIDRKLNRKVISELVTLDARSYVLQRMDQAFKTLIVTTVTEQDQEAFYTQTINDVLKAIHEAFEVEFDELREKLNNDCEKLFKKPIVADFREKSDLVSLLVCVRYPLKSPSLTSTLRIL